MTKPRIVRGERPQGEGFEQSQSGTVYWTLSLYVDPDKVAKALRQPADSYISPDIFRAAQMRHFPSLALRNAIDPLMNDIADRDAGGKVQEFLFATTTQEAADLVDAAKLIRDHEDIIFRLPAATQWTTEGVTFRAEPAGLDDYRLVRLRRFWMSHNNGALSYHLSFSHFYGEFKGPKYEASKQAASKQADNKKIEWDSGYDPATYYFLSLLQKLGAPKEYALKEDHLDKIIGNETMSVFDDDLGIAPLDDIELFEGSEPQDDESGERFWPFVKRRFLEDAGVLFKRLAESCHKAAGKGSKEVELETGFEQGLLEETPFIEVPGLTVPKSRFMFMLHDERFFDRLMPLDPDTGKTSPRKPMVQDLCYQAYHKELSDRIEARGDDGVMLDDQYWHWVCNRWEQYASWIKAPRGKKPILRPSGGGKFANLQELAAAMRSGAAEMALFDKNGKQLDQYVPVRIPAFQENRTDCLDYLFLSGFNQNIIDFMNQDTSEILDSIDPIYPDSDEQSDERFFVRYANHRAMITYVPRSRSLESGNDYIGTCPYAFLIHAYALHNEFLARAHEARSFEKIKEIENAVKDSDDSVDFLNVGLQINAVKLSKFHDYEQFRHANVFRYDTERDVFAEIEQLRGTDRKQQALELAISSLEDHARDLDLRQQRVEAVKRQDEEKQRQQQRDHEEHERTVEADRRTKEADDRERRERGLNAVLGALGLFGFVDIFLKLGDYFDKHPLFAAWPDMPLPDGRIWGLVLGNFGWVLGVIGVIVLVILIWPLLIIAVRNFGAIRNHFRSLAPKDHDGDKPE